MASSSSPSASPDEAHSTLESGTVTDGIKSVDIPDHNSHVNHTDLPTRIHVASRAIHHTLHQAVVGRLPLTLPPKTTSPHLYSLGISRFSRLYSTFETAWRDYLSTPPTDHDPNNDQARYHTLLSETYTPAITRSARLTSDISNLQREWGDQIASVAQPAEHDAALRDAVAHITETTQRKPYVLLAYSWIMYMALFNGGRWIRDQLVNAGPEFWFREDAGIEKADSTMESTFLSFWSFDGDEDGEDIKRIFRAGFEEASRKHLTEAEREDVIHEAKALFQHCINIVSEVDVVVALERKRQDDELREHNHHHHHHHHHHHQGMGTAERQSLLIIITLGVGLALAISYYTRLMTYLGY
ncbi:hypothetical protein DPV78_005578 [Talaromyces pinophilus]|nr:hypothetical protein DPV78_005578 [Talaromyces pinophilus]